MALALICGFLSPADPPYCQIGVPFAHQFVASGGSGDYTYYLFYGAADLNGGLTCSDSGLLSGTPNTSVFTPADLAQGYKQVAFWVFVFDNATLQRVGLKCGMGFYQNCLPLGPTGGNPTNGTTGLPYSFQYEAVFGIPPYTWTLESGDLPPGLTLNADGSVTGTPTLDGLYTFFVTVTGSGDPTNNVATFTSQIQIGPDGPSPSVNNAQLYFFAYGFLTALDITCGGPPEGIVGQLYEHLVPIFTGSSTGPYTFTITAGALCPGLTLDALSGIISGIPTATGSFPFTIQVVDSSGSPQSADVECTLTVTAAELTIECGDPPNGKVNAPYSHTFPAEGGVAPLSFAITAGALPSGLALLAPVGTVEGIPTTPGLYTFIVQVTDADDSTADVECSIRICPMNSQGS